MLKVSRILKTAKIVFHGSPHEFKEFKLEHVGSGEGSQSFGWGLYFTEIPSKADFYAKSITRYRPNWLLDGRPFKKNKAEQGILELLLEASNAESVQDVLRIYQAEADGWKAFHLDDPGGWRQKYYLERKASVEQFADRVSIQPSVVYEVQVPEDEHYLLWDSTEQPAILAKAMGSDYTSDTGKNIYHRLIQLYGSPKAASQTLDGMGIYGIKYLESESRDGKGEVYNLVIFNDARVKIIKKRP